MKKLLVVYHSQSGKTEQMAQAVLAGSDRETEVECRFLTAFKASAEDLIWCDGVLFGTPENFGTMSGAIKDFFDRTYDEVEPLALNLPYALFVSAGNDGSGAVREIDRILRGYPMRKIADSVVIKGQLDASGQVACEELGQSMAAGLALGIF